MCIHTLFRDLLFGTIYDTFSSEDDLSKTVFLEYLKLYITNSRLTTIRTLVSKDFIGTADGVRLAYSIDLSSFPDHYAQLGEYKLLESCILHLNPKCLDIHQVCNI